MSLAWSHPLPFILLSTFHLYFFYPMTLDTNHLTLSTFHDFTYISIMCKHFKLSFFVRIKWQDKLRSPHASQQHQQKRIYCKSTRFILALFCQRATSFNQYKCTKREHYVTKQTNPQQQQNNASAYTDVKQQLFVLQTI